MTDHRRLIEVAFPLKQASLDSVHEKNVRHGHISTLHIWPARRPLAACRAALIATLLPDPGTPEERKRLLEKIGGTVVQKVEKKKVGGKTVEVIREETVGGILHWGRESNPDIEWFRREIRKAYGGRAPKVLDPFAGGGAIPLEAMRLGCEVTASDINPVAWLILKCTLEYPQRLAGQHRPLPRFALESPEFMESFFKGTGKLTKRQLERNLQAVQAKLFPPPDVDLAWHVRAWGSWVLQRAKADLERFYPTVDGRPTVAYLWARTVQCKNCRVTLPLLKTRWLCKKDDRRVLLAMKLNADRSGVVFGIESDVPVFGSNAAQRREHDKRIAAGTMSRSGATCPCCGAIMTMEDVRMEGQAGRLGTVLTTVVVEGPKGKEYRAPFEEEVAVAVDANAELVHAFVNVPFGLLRERLPSKEALGFRVPLYGFDEWRKLFTARQLLALATFVKLTRLARETMRSDEYPKEWAEAISAYLGCIFSRTADYMANVCVWENGAEEVKHVFMRWALPITWDFAEANPLAPIDRFYSGAVNSAFRVLSGLYRNTWADVKKPILLNQSAIVGGDEPVDLIFTDPPYYDAIPYADLMDFFYVWLRRTVFGLSPEIDSAFCASLSPKWNHDEKDGELIDDESRHGGNADASRRAYEDGIYRAFLTAYRRLKPEGYLLVVFANKNPVAWETLAASIIHAGFCVTGSWPIATEMPGGLRNLNRASLASSIWLVCKKRPETARPGWDNRVLDEMRGSIYARLRNYWDAGIRGPDFVWAATGPALEAYSKHPVVKKANEPDQTMEVSQFLRHVRRIVVDFVVGRVLSHDGTDAAIGLDDLTTYYLLHRHDFGMDDAPIGACILYAVSCGLSDRELTDQFEVLVRTGGQAEVEEDEKELATEDVDGELEEGTGSKVKLRPWHQRKRKSLGYEAPGGRPVPLIDQVHRLMHLWKAGDVIRVDEYLDARALRKNALFHQLLQALIELAGQGTEERSLLESISNHIAASGVSPEQLQRTSPDMLSVSEPEAGE